MPPKVMFAPGATPPNGPDASLPQNVATTVRSPRRINWAAMMGWRHGRGVASITSTGSTLQQGSGDSSESEQETEKAPVKWNMGMLNDRFTEEVPGSVLLLSKVSTYNEPLGIHNAPARTSASSLPSQTSSHKRSGSSPRRKFGTTAPDQKRTADGKFVLDPQPADSGNDPLNWQVWRRDAALYSLGFYCMMGGGMTTILAAGFNNVAFDYGVSEPRVALTTGLYMLGLGLGSVVLSPTAILYGKRPVYLVAAMCFVLSAVWCALSPNFASLVCARIFQGFAVSSVECLPSATIAEIYFLHEKGYRLGIYTLLLLGGKNLVPLASAAVINSLGWRWVFWILAIIVGFAGFLLFFFVPETFWDRTPVVKTRRPRSLTRYNSFRHFSHSQNASPSTERKPRSIRHDETEDAAYRHNSVHAHFIEPNSSREDVPESKELDLDQLQVDAITLTSNLDNNAELGHQSTPTGYLAPPEVTPARVESSADPPRKPPILRHTSAFSNSSGQTTDPRNEYTRQLAALPKQPYLQQLKLWSGRRLSHDNWLKVAVRPFILFAYPNILWSALVYTLSVGWLIVLSESVTTIFKSSNTYNFTSLQAGLVYISPFIGGVLGTVVAGKVSDLVVRWLARKNGGIYEPEFRLIMTIPITFATVIGLMGYGWSVQEHDAWIVPTVFFGIISFGCCMGSTTAITFAVDSYRQYAGEALVTLNFSKNILHGLVWSLFFNDWLQKDGSRTVFVAIGGIQLACLLTTIPVYIYGKRSRMWTVRRNLMERF